MRYYVAADNVDYLEVQVYVTARDALYAAHVMAKAHRKPFKVYSVDENGNHAHIATVIPGDIGI